MPWSLLRFIAVGATGFVIDCGLLTLLVEYNFAILPARLLSFACAVTVTGLLHRQFTFPNSKEAPGPLQAKRHLIVQCLGAFVNLALFFLLQESVPAMQSNLALALGLSAMASLGVTYLLSLNWAFHPANA